MINFRSLFFFLTVCAFQSASLFCVPQITSLSSNSGPITGLNTITINGFDFTGATSVKIGDQTINSFISNSGTAIEVLVPSSPFVGTVDISVLRGSETSLYTPEAQYTYQGGSVAYVTGKSTGVFSFGLTAQTEGQLIFDSFSLSSPLVLPYKVAFLPGGQFAYVGSVGDDNMLKLNSTTSSFINLNGNRSPGFPAISSDGKSVYVQTLFKVAPPNAWGFFQIDTASNHINTSITSSVDIFSPNDSVVHPNNKYVYRFHATNPHDDSTCIVFSVADNLDIATVPLANTKPSSAAITPDGKFLYVTNNDPPTASVLVLTIGSNFIPSLTSSIPTGSFPTCIAISADGKYAIVTSQTSNVITRINLSDNSTTTANIPDYTLSPNPSGVSVTSTSVAVAISSDSKTAYILDYKHGNIVVLDVETLAFSPTRIFFPADYYSQNAYDQGYIVTESLAGIAISPDQAPVALFSAVPESPENSKTIIFDASKSVSSVGSVVKYDWNFGDGTTATTTTPTVSHTYAAILPYEITLTVTNSGGTSTEQTFTGHTVSNQGSSRARLSKSLLAMLSGSSSETCVPPQQFMGKIKKAKNHHFVLQTTWTPSTSSNVSSYEIFACDTLIAAISPQGQRLSSASKRHVFVTTASAGTLGVTFDLSTSDYYKDHMRKYEKYLEGKYRLRAVYTNGCVSDFVLLKIK